MCTSPVEDPMQWKPLVCLKAAGNAKVVTSKAIAALDLHSLSAH